MQATSFLHGLSKFACHTPRVHRCTVCHGRHHLGVGGGVYVVVVAGSIAPYAKYAALSSTFWGDRNDPMPEDGVANSIIRKLEVTIRVPTYSVVACHCLVLNRIIGLCSLFTANAPSAAPICSRVDIALFSCPLPVFKNRLESCSHKVFFFQILSINGIGDANMSAFSEEAKQACLVYGTH